MLLSVAAVLLGFALLIYSADRFVHGAGALAEHWGVPKLVVGLVLVGLGTSAPEMFVAAAASMRGQTGMAIGNALGSNFTNIALVLGASALIAPLAVSRGLAKRELPVLLGITIACFALCLDGRLGRVDGILFAVMLVGVLTWLAMAAKDSPLAEDLEDSHDTIPQRSAVFWTVVGLIVLPLSSHVLVWGASDLAFRFGVSDLVIGLTVVAIGTSLPELAASGMSAAKGESDIAMGNVIGSNLFNVLGVLAMPALIAPGLVPVEVLRRDFPIVVLITAVLFGLVWLRAGRGKIGRVEGCGLLLVFVAYEIYLLNAG